MQKNESSRRPHTSHKKLSKWTTDLNVKYKTMKLLGENTGKKTT